jgi:diguanylate cyclase (GGDEF)-like protein
MNKYLNDRLAKSINKKKPIAVLFIDVDKFKTINDSYGHACGDRAIQHVAHWLSRSIRKEDLAIRLGGDEFLVILQHVRENEFEKIAHRIVDDIPSMELPDESDLDMSLSAGCVYYQPERGDTPNANWLIDRADQSMYNVKKNGGDSVSIQKFTGACLAVV